MDYIKKMHIVFFVLLGIGAAAFSGPPVFAAEGYDFVKAWGSSGSGNGEFNSPYGISFADPGSLYVTDQNNNRVQKFSVSGTFSTVWGSSGSGDGQYNHPAGIVYDGGNARIFVVDRDNNRAQKLTSSGAYVTTLGSSGSGDGQFSHPVGIAKMPVGVAVYESLVYVADTGNNRIQIMDNAGAFKKTWGSPGTGNGQFNAPCGIAVTAEGTAGYVYVADYNNNRVQKFSADGTFITSWGSTGTDNGQFNGPFDITIDNKGNVYVTDYNNHRVQKFTSGGSFVARWGSEGTGDGQFKFPRGIALHDGTSSADIFVVDSGNNRIQKFTVTTDSTATTTPGGVSSTTTIPGGTTTTPGGSTTTVPGGTTTIPGGGTTTTVPGNATTTSPGNTTSIPEGSTTTIPEGTTTTIIPGQVVADFSASPLEGYRPLTVNFVNLSQGDIDTCLWNFGDGQESSQQDPTHVYRKTGTYSIVLKVFGKNGTQSVKSQESYIVVKSRCIFVKSLYSRDAVSLIRALRNLFLDNTYGAYLASLYYQNEEEINGIIEHNPGLQEEFSDLAQESLVVAAERINAGEAAITATALNKAVAFLYKIKAEGSPQLQMDIDIIIMGIARGYLLQGLGIRVD